MPSIFDRFRTLGTRWCWALLVLLACVVPCHSALASTPDGVRFTPSPAWVDPFPPDDLTPPKAVGGLSYLLVDDQVSLRGDQPADYRRVVYDIVDRSGLEDGGRLSIGFQPEFHTVEIHALTVQRGDLVEDRREQARIEILRTEDRLADGILDGWRNAEVLIPDIELGDRVELAYSVIGDNPTFAGRYHARFEATYSQALGARRLRVLEGRDAVVSGVDGPVDFAVDESRDAGGRVLTFLATDLPGIVGEDSTPEWFDGYGQIEIATTETWTDVAEWSSGLFARSPSAQAALREKAADLALAGKAPEDAFLAALEYVQSDIRYVSLSIGESSHVPASPELTLQRRYGDCKDKSSLLVGLLAEVGIEAQPVLVDTERGPRLPEGLAGTGSFDHAIVRVRIDGEWVYADPTRWTEHGPLAGREPIRYAWGLPVAAGVDGLEAIPVPPIADDEFLVDVEQRMEIVDVDGEEQVGIEVTTTYARGEADAVRARFSADGSDTIQRDHLDYMRGMYRDIEVDREPAIDDDRVRNRVLVTEHYRMPTLGAEDEESDASSVDLILFQIEGWVPGEDSPARDWPLALDGPESSRHRIVFTHPLGWDIEPEHEVVENQWFRFERTVELVEDELVLTGTWQRLADHVPAESYADIRDDLETVRGLIGYGVVFGGPTAARTMSVQDLPWLLLALVLLAVALGLAWHTRQTNVPAGMLFAPRTTVATRIESAAVAPAIALLLAVGAVTALMTIVPNHLAGNAIDWRLAGKETAQNLPYQALFVALLWLGLRILGTRTTVRRLFIASAWGAIPMLLFMPLAFLAAAGASAAIAEPALQLDGPFWIIGLTSATGIVLFLLGLVWTIASTFIGSAAAAGTSVWRIIAVNAAVIALVIGIVFLVVAPSR